ncbi:TetR/AcrR family transcriptional regulator [Aquimarina sp. 2201CG5-10]|uniref:TetR/AcrR family transcriptional regulator n=1 Tax=Aquimarina callyspongiae TaxID=3098150 RepID=UPI002AB3E91B|nr:TetR/AcrR family transcriptional regulator [Aquimarina sp. 2201CG5-10]MDY8136218.1 TetR/AcrR family transcriptional regulator [Aquimarina sp. 2201CG5-10]
MPKVESFDRKVVLQKATEVFHNKGYNGTSMQDLVDATELNRSSIYNSFGSKLSMFLEVLTHYQSIYNKKFSTELSNVYNAAEGLDTIFKLYIDDILTDDNQKGCLIVNCKAEMANQELSIKAFMEKNQDRMLAVLEDIVNKGQMEKVFNNDQTATQYALYLFSAIQGLRMVGILNKNENELRSIVKSTTKVLL